MDSKSTDSASPAVKTDLKRSHSDPAIYFTNTDLEPQHCPTLLPAPAAAKKFQRSHSALKDNAYPAKVNQRLSSVSSTGIRLEEIKRLLTELQKHTSETQSLKVPAMKDNPYKAKAQESEMSVLPYKITVRTSTEQGVAGQDAVPHSLLCSALPPTGASEAARFAASSNPALKDNAYPAKVNQRLSSVSSTGIRLEEIKRLLTELQKHTSETQSLKVPAMKDNPYKAKAQESEMSVLPYKITVRTSTEQGVAGQDAVPHSLLCSALPPTGASEAARFAASSNPALKDNAYPAKVNQRLSSVSSTGIRLEEIKRLLTELQKHTSETQSLKVPAMKDNPYKAKAQESNMSLLPYEVTLWTSTERGVAEEHFVERHQQELIRCAVGVNVVVEFLEFNAVITFHQMRDIKGTDQEQMQKLYELMPAWRTSGKDRLQEILKKTNRRLIGQLAGGHFVDRHREELIEQVTEVPLNQLRGFVLDEEQYETLLNCTTAKMQMSALFQMKQEWDRQQKDWLYRVLAETEPDLTNVLEEGHFVDRHREELIERVTKVPLSLLGEFVLDEEYKTLLNCTTAKMQMLAMFQMEKKRNRQRKDRLYRVLAETNPDVIKILEEEHFIEKHQEEVIHRACRVNTVLQWLHDQHSLIKEESDQKKMFQLYTLVPRWNRKQKDHLYTVLKKTNGPLIAELEEGHFVERHKEYLMKNIIGERKVALILMEQCTISCHVYGDILGKKKIMEMLYELVPSWNGEQKNCLYRAFRSTNERLIKELESRKSRKDGLIPNCLAEKCCLCEREKDFLEIQPELVPNAEEKLTTYRIHLPKAGTFLCSVTELKFEVKAAVTLEYAFRSWDQHLSEAVMQTWMVAGPLFDIRADAEEKVAAVHLPHFLCLRGRKTDESQMKIAHFTDVGMTLEKPAQVTQFHAVLENPKFSLLGVLIKPIYDKFFRVHAVVLLYQAYKRITALNLYLVPNDSSLIQAIKDEEEKFHSVLVRKPPQTKEPLHYGSHYTVSSSADLKISPQELEFTYKTPGQLQSFVEVRIIKSERVDLSMKNKEERCCVWDTLLEPEDLLVPTAPTELKHSEAAIQVEQRFSRLEIREERTHFIELHREQLIQRTCNVEGVLDILFGSEILDEEQYQRVLLKGTNQEKMRELYQLVPSWNRACKDKLYSALKMKNKFLVQELEGS
ncbi:uncharacterized protein LOC129338334 isoform X1 [Eublepharis macularius]|uniref:Uncharacterized protein LOC129338334 isoform X1 n=1 Tax=Eublepharis macularius TaxID=481883 RepID=A0AA97K017_EUBMA|nr:uncharacterized protein LOC129338334 isoform X1 [Eublepharis macularius]